MMNNVYCNYYAFELHLCKIIAHISYTTCKAVNHIAYSSYKNHCIHCTKLICYFANHFVARFYLPVEFSLLNSKRIIVTINSKITADGLVNFIVKVDSLMLLQKLNFKKAILVTIVCIYKSVCYIFDNNFVYMHK